MRVLLIGLGGAAGSIARYGVGLWTTRRWPGFPWGTLAVNVVGSFALALVMTLALRGKVDEMTRIALGTGVLGGFTTYSSFNYETLALAQAGSWARAVVYVVVMVTAGVLAGLLGWWLARSA